MQSWRWTWLAGWTALGVAVAGMTMAGLAVMGDPAPGHAVTNPGWVVPVGDTCYVLLTGGALLLLASPLWRLWKHLASHNRGRESPDNA